MTPHRILPQALAELDAATSWYENQEQGLGLELVVEYRSVLSQALKSGSAGSPIGVGLDGTEVRRYRLHRFGRYAIIMAVLGGIPNVLAFEHSSRKPRYWNQRTE